MDLKSEQITSAPKPELFSEFVYFQLVSDNNYNRFEVDALTNEQLKKLANFSENIESPFILGKFNNENHYLDTLVLVLSSTHETHNRVSFILNEILPGLPEHGSLLDVGPGDGTLTNAVAHKFKHITLIDVNHHALHNLQKRLAPSTHIEQISTSISNVELPSEQYNLAILSHMLYYIEPESWLTVITSAYNSLKNNGVLVAIMGGDELGKSELIKHFGGQTLEIDQLATQCCNTFGVANVDLFASNESFIACTKEAMLHISAFMLADANIVASKDDLIRYITQNFKKSDSYFEMTTKQKYIIIKKNNYLRDEIHGINQFFVDNQSKN